MCYPERFRYFLSVDELVVDNKMPEMVFTVEGKKMDSGAMNVVLRAENEFLKQSLIDELNKKPLLIKLEKDRVFMSGAGLGFLIGFIMSASIFWR